LVFDPGIDDMLAVMALVGLGQAPEALVATAGNVELDRAYQNASCIVAALGLDTPLARGVEAAGAGPYPDSGGEFHGPDGLGGTSERLGAGRPLDPGREPEPEPLSLVAGSVLVTAPLTVVAAALRAGRPITEIIWMGGTIGATGNITAVAEYNAWMDPEAADEVLTSEVATVSIVPLDITHQVALGGGDLSELAGGGGAVAELAAAACGYICDRDGVMYPHDATAAIAQTDPGLFAWEERSVRCETTGRFTRGMTVVDRRRRASPGRVRVAVAVDAPAVKGLLFQALHRLG
jgi:pyrimidine-specific ribonucleoside hydrolase